MIPATIASAIPASKGIFEWGSHHGLPCWVISDGGRHLRLEAGGRANGFKTPHHPGVLPGAIEFVGQDMIYTVRAVLSEFEMPIEEWDEVIPFIQYVINHRPRERLGGRCPIEVVTGRKPKMALDLALWVGVKLEDAAVIDVAVDRVNKYCDRLQQAIDNMHEELLDQELQRHREKMSKEANGC